MAQVQATFKRAIEIEGVGLHSGAAVRLRILPAGTDEGISFSRTDLGGTRVPVAHRYLRGSCYATSLARNGTRVATVEHILAALVGLGIDNAHIEVDGPEVPILDGSARPFVDLLLAAGLQRLNAPRRFLGLDRPVTIRQGDRSILALPSNELRITYGIDFPHPAIGHQAVTVRPDREAFASSIAPARTFCMLREVEAMREAGLARGGSLENAVVVGEDGVLNGSLRFPDEFVRHKVLDLIGDLALLSAPLRAHVIAFKGGHKMHAALVGTVLSSRAAWTLRTSDEELPRECLSRFDHLREQVFPSQAVASA